MVPMPLPVGLPAQRGSGVASFQVTKKGSEAAGVGGQGNRRILT